MHNFQSFTLKDCTLDPKKIDIFQFPLFYQHPYALDLLNEEEQARAWRFHFEKHRRRFIIARSGLRLLLAHYLDCSAQDIEFDYNQYGKPKIAGKQQIEFNLSHSGEWALLAIGQTFPLGVDIEFFSARPFEAMAKHVFSTTECKNLYKLTKMNKALGFFHIWSQKEAFIKASGLGLSYTLDRFSVPILPKTNQQIWDPIHEKYWYLHSFMPQIACAAALCFDPSIQCLRKMQLPPSALYTLHEPFRRTKNGPY